MRRIAAAAAVLMLIGAMIGCSGTSVVSEDEARTAFIHSYGAVFVSSLVAGFGEELEGASLDPETNELTFDDFDLAAFFEAEGGRALSEYTSISGTVTQDAGEIVADLTLEGGPVSALEFSVSSEMIQQAVDGFTATVTANGTEIEINVSATDLQSR